MSNNTRARILCVDDEPRILEGLTLHLRRQYEVETATGGIAGLHLIRRGGAFAAVISDMRMPGMDGAVFLASSRKFSPDTVRLLLTGQADLDSAVAAINQGQIFRFLTKPCPPADLLAAVAAAVEQHRLITAERVLLEETLHGSIKTLVEVLALANPLSFGRATRIKQHVSDLADKLEIQERWQVEVAAMLSQLGCIVLPAEVAEKLYHGRPLSPEEDAMVERLPAVTEQLLGNIPRLESVRGILSTHLRARRPEDASEHAEKQLVTRGAEMLRIASDFDLLESRGNSAGFALSMMAGRDGRYDPLMLAAFSELQGPNGPRDEVRELPLSELRAGMVLAEDLRMGHMLLVARGCEVTQSFVERVRNFGAGMKKEPLRVIIPARMKKPAAAASRRPVGAGSPARS
jgi:DNA-binding response OmpR family regulator